MSIIYVITEGWYSDYHIVGAFSTRENAQTFLDHFPSVLKDASIEEWELDPGLEQIHRNLNLYWLFMDRDGNTRVNSPTSTKESMWWTGFLKNGLPLLGAEIWARDEVHAIKILNERRAAILAANAWGDQKILEQYRGKSR